MGSRCLSHDCAGEALRAAAALTTLRASLSNIPGFQPISIKPDVDIRRRRSIFVPITDALRDAPSDDGNMQMAALTYYVVLAFTRSEDGDIIGTEPKEARSVEQAIRMAKSLAATEPHCGAVAFSRTGDPAIGDFEDAVILKAIGEVDDALLQPTL